MYEIIKKIIGQIQPCGDSNIDEERVNNLADHIKITKNLINDLIEVSQFKDKPEYSMKKIGDTAYKSLVEIKNVLEENIIPSCTCSRCTGLPDVDSYYKNED
jgi:hypothetical protein